MTEETQAPLQGTEGSAPEAPPQAPPETPPQAPPESALGTEPSSTETPPAEPEGEQPQAVERVVPAADGYKLPEGVAPQLGQLFNQMDLTQEQAEGVLKLDSVRTKAQNEALRNAGVKHIEGWGDAAKTNLNLAQRGRDLIDPSGQLRQLLNESGAGNDPRILEMFYQFGKRMEEGGFLESSINTTGQPKETAHLWYPDQAPKS